jgi:3-phenylpropionate/trans-cinnamate dioxygenase ferredoxin reductase component
VHPPGWYAEHEIDLRLATAVTGIDRHGHTVATADGNPVPYDKLLLCTGASPRRLPVPGADHPAVHYLRSIDDSDRLRARLRPGTRLVIIGGGWIGLETAAAARAAGAEVTVLEHSVLPLLPVLGHRLARVFAELHVEHGVDLRCGVTVAAVQARGSDGVTVLLDGDTRIDADAVVVGVGAVPNDGLARSCGLPVDNGIVVDQHLCTCDPDILAAGDVANAYHPLLHRRLRVEHWANALHQPVVAARTLLGRTADYDRLPYFFTDQYDLGMEYTGYTDPAGTDDVVVRGDIGARTFMAFWLRELRVVAAMNVNVWEVAEPVRQLIRSGHPVDAARLADPDVPLEQLA